MSKQKNIPNKAQKKTNVFYYEIKGICLLLIAIFSLLRVGILGLYLSLILKLLFGDWYFIIIILMFAIGGYYLFKHEKLKLNSLRLIGFILITIPLIVLSHNSLHEYIIKINGNPFFNSFKYYVDYFKKGSLSGLTGGGIIGMMIFYAIYSLLSKVGVIILCSLMLVLGICLLSKKTFDDYLKMIIKMIFYGRKKLIISYHKVKKAINSLANDYQKKGLKINKSNFKRSNIYDKDVLERRNQRFKQYEKMLNEGFKKSFLTSFEYKMILTPHLYVFEVMFSFNMNPLIILNTVKKIYQTKCLVKETSDHLFIIEISDELCNHLMIGDVFERYHQFFLTINNYNDDLALSEDDFVLIFERNSTQFLALILINFVMKEPCIIFDIPKEYGVFKPFVDNYHESINELDDYIIKLEKGIFEKANIFINLNESLTENELEKVRYLTQLCLGLNQKIICRINKMIHEHNYFYDSFNIIIDSDIKDLNVLRLFGFEDASSLNFKNELLIKEDDLIYRGLKVEVEEDYELKI